MAASPEQQFRHATFLSFDGDESIRKQPFHGIDHDGIKRIAMLILEQFVFVVFEPAEKSLVQCLANCLTMHRHEPPYRSRDRLGTVACGLSLLSFQTALFILLAAATGAGIVTSRLFHENSVQLQKASLATSDRSGSWFRISLFSEVREKRPSAHSGNVTHLRGGFFFFFIQDPGGFLFFDIGLWPPPPFSPRLG